MFCFFSFKVGQNEATPSSLLIVPGPEKTVCLPKTTESKELSSRPEQTPVPNHQVLLKTSDIEVPNSSNLTVQPPDPSVRNDQVKHYNQICYQ